MEILMTNDKMEKKEDQTYLKLWKSQKQWHFSIWILLGHKPAPAWPSLHGSQHGCLLQHGPPRAAGNKSHHGSHPGLQRNLCSGVWSTSSPSFFTDFGVCRAGSLAFFSLISLTTHMQIFLPFLKYVIKGAPPA